MALTYDTLKTEIQREVMKQQAGGRSGELFSVKLGHDTMSALMTDGTPERLLLDSRRVEFEDPDTADGYHIPGLQLSAYADNVVLYDEAGLDDKQYVLHFRENVDVEGSVD